MQLLFWFPVALLQRLVSDPLTLAAWLAKNDNLPAMRMLLHLRGIGRVKFSLELPGSMLSSGGDDFVIITDAL